MLAVALKRHCRDFRKTDGQRQDHATIVSRDRGSLLPLTSQPGHRAHLTLHAQLWDETVTYKTLGQQHGWIVTSTSMSDLQDQNVLVSFVSLLYVYNFKR